MNNRIKKARLAAGLTQEQLALELDVSKRQLQNYEAGASEPPARVIADLATVTGVTVNYLLGDFPRLPGWQIDFVLPFASDMEQTPEQALALLLKETDLDLFLAEVEEDGLEHTKQLLASGWLVFYEHALVGLADGPYRNKEGEELFKMYVRP